MSDMSLLIDRPLNSPRNKMMKTCGMILSITPLTSQVLKFFRFTGPERRAQIEPERERFSVQLKDTFRFC